MLDGNCRSIRIALLGSRNSGKTEIACRLKAVTSFDKMFAGAPPPPQPTDCIKEEDTENFTSYVSLDVVLQHCHKAASHRTYLISTPANIERAALYRGLLPSQGGTMTGGIDGVIIFCGACSSLRKTEPAEREKVDEAEVAPDRDDDDDTPAVLQYLDDCEANNCHVLLVHCGPKAPSPRLLNRIDSFKPNPSPLKTKGRTISNLTGQLLRTKTATPDTPLPTIAELKNMPFEERDAFLESGIAKGQGGIRFVVVEDVNTEGFVEVARAFVQLVQDIHDALQLAEMQFAKLKEEYHAALTRQLARIPPVALVNSDTVANCKWFEQHQYSATKWLQIILCGAPNTGKTTFVTALVDGFVIKEYEPTSEVEIAHACVDLGGLDGTVNLTVVDGIQLMANLSENKRLRCGTISNSCASALITILDVSDPYGVDRWKEELQRLPVERPPHMGIVAVRNNSSSASLFSTEFLMDLAGSHNAFFEYLDPRTASADRLLVARFVAHIRLLDNQTRLNLERQQLIYTKLPSQLPYSEDDINLLFHRYDTDGAGVITLAEAKAILEEYQLGLFGETFDECVTYIEREFGLLTRSRDESHEKLMSKDQLGLLLCRLNKQ